MPTTARRVGAQVLPVVGAAQAALRHQVVEQNPAGLGADAEQPRCLIQVKGQSRHLAERANHHGDELLPAGLGDSATGLLPPLGRFVSLR